MRLSILLKVHPLQFPMLISNLGNYETDEGSPNGEIKEKTVLLLISA